MFHIFSSIYHIFSIWIIILRSLYSVWDFFFNFGTREVGDVTLIYMFRKWWKNYWLCNNFSVHETHTFQILLDLQTMQAAKFQTNTKHRPQNAKGLVCFTYLVCHSVFLNSHQMALICLQGRYREHNVPGWINAWVWQQARMSHEY